VVILRHLEESGVEGLDHYAIPLAIRLQFEFAARRSEICMLEWDWVDLEQQRVVWPDSKTGGISKSMGEEAYRLLSTAPRWDNFPYVLLSPSHQRRHLPPHPSAPCSGQCRTWQYSLPSAGQPLAAFPRRHLQPPCLSVRLAWRMWVRPASVIAR